MKQNLHVSDPSVNVYPVAFPIPTRRQGISTRSDWVAPTAFWKRPDKDVPHVRVENDFWKEGMAAKIGPVAQAVLFYLRSRADKYVQCWPEVPTIAEQIGSSESNVKRALKVLEKFGLIVKAPCFYEGTLKSTSNLYVLCPLASFREPGQPEPSRVQIEPTKPRVEGSNRTANKEPSTSEEGRIEEGTTTERAKISHEPELHAGVVAPLHSSSSMPTKREALSEKSTHETYGPRVEKPVKQGDSRPQVPSEAVSGDQGAQPSSEPSIYDVDLLAALLLKDVKRKVALELLAKHSPEDVRLQLDCLPYRESRNPAAVLVQSIRDNWLPPQAYTDKIEAQEAQEAAQRERETQSRDQAMKAQQRASVRQERVSAQEETARLDAEWEAMAPSGRARIERETIVRLGILGATGRASQGARTAMRRNLQREQGTLGARPGPLFQ